MSFALEADGLAKQYGARTAVQDLSFRVPQGSICGVLGPNGAGKSSTLRMLVGVLEPSVGSVSLLGGQITRKTLRRVGYLPEERGLYRGMSARAAIAYLARLKGMGAGAAFKRADELLDAHGLGAVKRKKIKTLSKGMAQKVQVLAAIAHEPDLIIFDEPFSGLDPVNQRVLEHTIRGQALAGKTVLFSTHVMEHAERLCDRIVLIDKGRKAFEGTIEEALALAPASAVIETPSGFDAAAALTPRGVQVERLPQMDTVHQKWRLRMEGADSSRRLLAACLQAQAPLTLFEPHRGTLHDVFVNLVGADAVEQGR